MKRSFKLIGASLLGVAWSGSLFAGLTNFNFDIDPASDPALAPGTGVLIVGTHNYANVNLNEQIWCSGAGHAVDGNPATGGYLSISDGTNANNNLAFVFPDIDGGLPLGGFRIDLDMRVGDGDSGRPADGFSVNFARAGDLVLVNATNGTIGGFAGGDGSVAAASSATGSTDVENGTKTGVAVVFDAWQGNYLPDTTPYSSPPAGVGSSAATDREGIAVRMDDRTLSQLDLILNRNEKDCIPTTQTTTTNNGTGLSIQTGTNAVVLTGAGTTACSRTYGATHTDQASGAGSYTNLVWQHLTVVLTNLPVTASCQPLTNVLIVTWKGDVVVSNILSTFSPYAGRLILAGRTGGSDENVHVDNIQLRTTPLTSVTLGSINGLLNGFTFVLNDNSNQNQNVTFQGVNQVKLDGTDVTGGTTVSYTAPNATGVFTQNTRFAPGSTHAALVCWRDSSNQTNAVQLSFTVPQWILFPTNLALPISAVDTTKVGMHVKPYQTFQNNPNQAWWTDEQVLGRRGPNIQGTGAAQSDAGGMYWDGPLDFFNGTGANAQRGFFTGVASSDNDLNNFGLGISGAGNFYAQNAQHDFYDNSALELNGYIYFPTSGVYQMVVGSDDGFQLSVAPNAKDRMGQVLWFNNGAAVPTPTAPPSFSAIRPVVVDQAGAYPIRMLWQNGGGQAAFEWYTVPSPAFATAAANVNSWLVNDTNNPSGGAGVATLFTYRALNGTVAEGPYVSDASPTRGAQDAVYYSPVSVKATDGGAGRGINDGSSTFTVDGGNASLFTRSRAGSVVSWAQTGVTNWAAGNHTNVLTLVDNSNFTNVYTWTWTVMGGVNGLATADATNNVPINNGNTLNYVVVPASLGVSAGAVNTGLPGFRVRSYQSLHESPGHTGWNEEQIEGLHGTNVTDQSSAPSGYFVFPDVVPNATPVIDWRFSYTGAGALNNGASGEFAYDSATSLGSFGAATAMLAPYQTYFRANRQSESCTLEIVAWLVFPNAGDYIMHINDDDGHKLTIPFGSLYNKMGLLLNESDTGRGVAGPAGGVQTGGSFTKFTITSPGAYPFRLLWYNSGGDAGIEWSMYQLMADGTVQKVLINDPNVPGSIKAYQALSAGDTWGIAVTYANPAFNAQDIMPWMPTVVELTDGPSGRTVNTGSIVLKTDGVVDSITTSSPSAGVTRITQNLSGFYPQNTVHTNILTYQDGLGTSYSNYWSFHVMSVNYATIRTLPGTNSVSTGLVDHSRPGWLVRSYQTADTGGSGPGGGQQNNTMTWTEEQLEGFHGPNIANQTVVGAYGGTNGQGLFNWQGPIDFIDNIGANGGNGEFRWNISFGTNFGFVSNGGGANSNDTTLAFSGWMEFTTPGYYAFSVNSDDGFKITSPYGGSPLSIDGFVLDFASTGRGNSGAQANPANQGSVTTFPFRIVTPGAYPIRMIWENGGGGLNVEWTIWHAGPKGDVIRNAMGDPYDPNPVNVYQALLQDAPYVSTVFPDPALPNGGGNNTGNGFPGPELTFTPGTDIPTLTSSFAPGGTNIANGLNDFTVQLTDGVNTTVNTNTIALTFMGQSQPITITTNGAGVTTIVRNANATPWWPSGAYGLLTLSYQDSSGATHYQTWNIATAFWGTLTNAVAASVVDTTKQGFAMRMYQVDPRATPGGTAIPNRVHVAEQELAGYYGPNVARLTNTDDGLYWDLKGTGKITGVINFDEIGGGENGDFRSTAVVNGQGTTPPGYNETLWPGIPGNLLNPFRGNAFASNEDIVAEILAFVEFPTNGNYILCFSSDDGFRATRGFTPPTNKGNVTVNAVGDGAALAGPKATVQDTYLTSYSLTSPLTADLALANGISFAQGSTTNGEGCIITNPGQLAGKIAVMYRSAFCGYLQQVQNAVNAGAVGVMMIQNRTNTEGPFPQEPGVFPPPQAIPTVEIEQADGNAIVGILQTNGHVNATFNVMDYYINPPAVNPVLGQADFGKGASDILFPVQVQQAGFYPLRVIYWNGGGGANAEFFSVTGTNRVLVNDMTVNTGPGPNGTGLRAFFPFMTVHAALSGSNIVLTWTGTLQSAPTPFGPWTTLPSAVSPLTIPANQAAQFYRSILPN